MEVLESILEEKGRAVHVIAPDATVVEAVDAMCHAHVGALLVMRGPALVGIFSERDLMMRVVLARLDPAGTVVGEVMTSGVVCVGMEVSPRAAMGLMTKHRVRHLPIIVDGRVAGVVSIGDLVRWTIADRDQVIGELQDYVTGRYPG